jgi:hypothetical protein
MAAVSNFKFISMGAGEPYESELSCTSIKCDSGKHTMIYDFDFTISFLFHFFVANKS